MTGSVSVVMATYNGERWVAAALESVLAQSRPPLEVIVCDDGSRDGTVDVLSGFGSRIQVIRQENRGVSAARNRAAAGARGDLIAFLDQDDAWLPELLETEVPALVEHPGWSCVYADSLVVDGADVVHGRRSEHLSFAEGEIFDALLDGNFIPIETLLMPTAAFRAIGGFREDLKLLEDWELCLRLARLGPVGLLPGVLARYRVHDTNLSHDATGLVSEYEQVLADMKADADLGPEQRAHVAQALTNRRGELAWYALRRGELSAADEWWRRREGRCRASLAWKVRGLRLLLGALPSACHGAVLDRLPRRRLYGR